MFTFCFEETSTCPISRPHLCVSGFKRLAVQAVNF